MDVPIVPVTQFRTTRTATDRDEVTAVLAGRSGRFDAVELVEVEADAILAALGVDRPPIRTAWSSWRTRPRSPGTWPAIASVWACFVRKP
ncbi:MAG: hypothetical protein WKF78_09685 [Candidatus Limnocylindrales bacterium]